MLYPRIAGIASYAPDDILDNEMLSKMVETTDEWITTRVGIKQRRILRSEGQGSSFLGIQAVNKLLESTGINAEDIDLLICATSNPDFNRIYHSTPMRFKKLLRLRHTGCLRRIPCSTERCRCILPGRNVQEHSCRCR